ncbi:MAG TPA: GNAT family N-acetyltransferase [bacterium]|jgi:GNAT superfamily N-acetyltransferase
MSMLSILQAQDEKQIVEARALFIEYAESLGFDLGFQGFEEEVAGLPGEYAGAVGRLLIAYLDGAAVGCGALRRISETVCEMKRLYVRPQARGLGIGKLLSEQLMTEAREIGYRQMRLDTIAQQMQTAVALYRAQGFREIEPYRYNPIPGALYMEKDLTPAD